MAFLFHKPFVLTPGLPFCMSKQNLFSTPEKGLGLSHPNPIYISSDAELNTGLKPKATSLLVLKDGQAKRCDGSLQDAPEMRSWNESEYVPATFSTSASSIFQTALGFIMVALCLGGTNPFIRNGSQGLREAIDRLPKNTSKIGKTAAEWKFLLTRWKYVVPLVLNLSGSVVYYYFLGKAGTFFDVWLFSYGKFRFSDCALRKMAAAFFP